MKRFLILLITIILFLAISFDSARITADTSELPSIIFVKQKPVSYTTGTISDIFTNVAGENPSTAQPIGGGLYRLDPDGTLSNLTNLENVAVRDPEISYDAKRVMFSMKQGVRGKWQLYEMNVDGSNLHRVSATNSNDWDPAYLPDGRILLVSDRLDAIAIANQNLPEDYLPEGKLFVMNADGSHIELINSSPHGTFNPFLASSGRIVFTQWDLNDLRANPEDPPDGISYSRFVVWEVTIDGSREGHPIFGEHLIQDFHGGFTEAREIWDGSGQMVATMTQALYTFGAGSIVRFTPRGNPNQVSVDWLTPPESYNSYGESPIGRYRSPYSLNNGTVIASYAPGAVYNGMGTPDFELVVLHDDMTHTVLYNDPEFWDWQPVAIEARPVPQIAQPATLAGYERIAIINAMDVELRDRSADTVPNGDYQDLIAPGTAAFVRIFSLDRPPSPYTGGDPNDQALREHLIGEAPVAEDGSFAAVVPARTMLKWDVVDKEGNVLVTERVWQELAPGEVRTCGGCHTPPTGNGRTTNLALANPANLTSFNLDKNNDGVVDLLNDYYAAIGKQ